MFEQICGNCEFYEKVQGKRHGYCRNPKSYYYGLKRERANKGADRCFNIQGGVSRGKSKKPRP